MYCLPFISESRVYWLGVMPLLASMLESNWKERKTLVVPDVEEFPGHIACSSLSRSEIVVPIFVQTDEDDEKEVWGVIDIDSTELNTFDEVDAMYLEKIAEILSKNIW